MDRIAVSITHESDYAVAIAFGIRTAGGRYVFPPDIEDRLDDRERRILARMERLRDLHERTPDAGRGRRGPWRRPGATVADRPARVRPARASPRPRRHGRPVAGARHARRRGRGRAAARAPGARPQGHRSGRSSCIAGSLDYAGAALLVCRAAGRAGRRARDARRARSRSSRCSRPRSSRRRRWPCPRTTSRRSIPEPAIARILDHEHDAIVVGPGLRPGLATAELVRLLLAVPDERRRAADRARRRGAPLAGDARRVVGRRPRGRAS